MKEQRSQFLSLETIFGFKVRDFRAKNPNKSIGDAHQAWMVSHERAALMAGETGNQI